MLLRNLGSDPNAGATAWTDLQEGALTVLGLARLCSLAISQPSEEECSAEQFSDEAKAILVLAAKRGVIDIRANRDAFDSADRFLAVCVESEPEKRLLFLRKDDPRQTISFLEGFRELCAAGMVIHHLQKDFSLTRAGFDLADQLQRSDFEKQIQFAVELDH